MVPADKESFNAGNSAASQALSPQIPVANRVEWGLGWGLQATTQNIPSGIGDVWPGRWAGVSPHMIGSNRLKSSKSNQPKHRYRTPDIACDMSFRRCLWP